MQTCRIAVGMDMQTYGEWQAWTCRPNSGELQAWTCRPTVMNGRHGHADLQNYSGEKEEGDGSKGKIVCQIHLSVQLPCGSKVMAKQNNKACSCMFKLHALI